MDEIHSDELSRRIWRQEGDIIHCIFDCSAMYGHMYDVDLGKMWYEEEQQEKLDCKEQDEGWFKLLGISTPPPPLSTEKIVL